MTQNIFLNGKFTDLNSACVSIEDRGLIFGDGIYEFIRCYRGRPFLLKEHLKRLKKSADAIELTLPYSEDELSNIINKLLNTTGFQESGIYLQVTRGNAPRDHCFPEKIEPTIFIINKALPEMEEEILEKGVKVILVPDERWKRCDIKITGLVPNVLAKEKARREGAYEAVFLHESGITEGASTNVFAVINGQLVTAPAEKKILHGITRQVVLNLAAVLNIPVQEKYMSEEEFLSAEEIFITGTRIEIIPVARVGYNVIGNMKPGKVTLNFIREFKKVVEKNIK